MSVETAKIRMMVNSGSLPGGNPSMQQDPSATLTSEDSALARKLMPKFPSGPAVFSAEPFACIDGNLFT